MAKKKKIKADAPKNDLQRQLLELAENVNISVILEQLDEIAAYKQIDNLHRRWYEETLLDIFEAKGYAVIKHSGSIAEIEQIESFKEKLYANPYQLKLIA